MSSLTLYVEGGGSTRKEQAPAREAFRNLLLRANFERRRLPEVIACGGRTEAIHDFKRHGARSPRAVLLVDAEGPVAAGSHAAEHLRTRGEWDGPVPDERIHLMVQVMESWFLTQPAVMASHFGKNFQTTALPSAADIETIAKDKVAVGLDKATQQCASGRYSNQKRQGFRILEKLDVAPIEKSSRFAKLFFDYLRRNC